MIRLTLDVDPGVAEIAERLARERETSVAELFTGFIRAMNAPVKGAVERPLEELAPITAASRGIAKPHPTKTDKEIYGEWIMEKFGS